MSEKKSDDVWPPGFVSQMEVDTSATKKAQAATRARETRTKNRLKARGTALTEVEVGPYHRGRRKTKDGRD